MPAAPLPTAEPRWTVRPPAPPREVAALSRALGVPPAIAAILWARGLRDDAPDHLNPPLRRSPNPGLDQAAERLAAAIASGRRVLIHGDYDADGITGSALLLLGLRELGGNVSAHVPNRLTDGYGIHPGRVDELASRADLLLTVDCGVTNLAEIAALRSRGVEVIVTDHHTPGEELPDCLVVHPRLSPLARAGLPELTGSGVAFHLLWALRERLGLEAPLDYADLATIGTIADVAPLLGENRALIKEGLPRLADSRWPGVRAMVRQSKLRGEVTAREVAFVLAPRLNAAGRLGEADKGLELLTTASERRASELAAYLDARNADRRRIQDEMLAAAEAKVDPGAPALVLEDPAWHPGVMGIVASKLLEHHYKPVFIAASGKGSVRSTPGVSAVEALRAAAEHLTRFGGHRQAAGFALDMSRFPGFRDTVLEYVGAFEPDVRTVVADAVIAPSEVDDGLYRAIRDLEPFGEGHASPLFAVAGRLEQARAVGATGTTLQLRVGGVKGVAWRLGGLAGRLPLGGEVHVAATIRESEWRDTRSLELLAEAVRPNGPLGLAPEARDEASQGAALLVARAPRPGVPTAPRGVPRGRLVAGPLDDPVAELERLVAAGEPFTLDLTEEDLARVEDEALSYPTVHELRRGLVAFRRGLQHGIPEPKLSRLTAALRELGLVDGVGRAVVTEPGRKLNPMDSPTLLAGLVRRYRLRNLVHAYRHFDDEAFAVAVV
ncbi:MAG TPA: single-stranded-DNA-specific exonuclease RecJ, partial [Trueperaceae bacterium]